MFEKWTQHLNHNDLSSIAYELSRRIRRKKPIYPLDPIPQTKPLILSEALTKIVDEIEAEIESQYQILIDEIDLETELKIVGEFDDLSFERLKAKPDYDPIEVKKMIDDLFSTVERQEQLRFLKGRADFCKK
jgi:hypothetical protein